MNNRLNKVDVLRLLEHALHNLSRKRRPCAVLNESDSSVLIFPLCQRLDKCAHKRKNICVIRRCCKYKLTVTESVLNSLRHIATCKVINNNLRAAVCPELVGKDFNRLFCIAVNGGIRNHNALTLYRI